MAEIIEEAILWSDRHGYHSDPLQFMSTRQACEELGGNNRSTLNRWANKVGIMRERNKWRKRDIDQLKRDHPT
jgi:hypothetical protein